MFLFVLWMAVGALAGSLFGVYRCSAISRELQKSGDAMQVGFCASVGALAGFLMFLFLGSVF